MGLNLILVTCMVIMEPLLTSGQRVSATTPALPVFPSINLAAISKPNLPPGVKPRRRDGWASFGLINSATTLKPTTSTTNDDVDEDEGDDNDDVADCQNNNCALNMSQVFEHRKNPNPVRGKSFVRKAVPAQVPHGKTQVRDSKRGGGGSAAEPADFTEEPIAKKRGC